MFKSKNSIASEESVLGSLTKLSKQGLVMFTRFGEHYWLKR